MGFPGGSVGKESTCNAGDSGLIPGSGKSHWEGNGNPIQYSCLANLMERGIWWATVYGVTEINSMIYLFIIFYDLSQNSSPCYAVRPCCLSNLSMHNSLHPLIPNSQAFHHLPLATTSLFSMSVSLSLFHGYFILVVL